MEFYILIFEIDNMNNIVLLIVGYTYDALWYFVWEGNISSAFI